MGRPADDYADEHTAGRRRPAADRARRRWGVERVLHAHRAAEPAADVARELLTHLRHLPVALLIDRDLPGGAAHLAVGPCGITAVVEAPLAGPLRVERVRGVFGATELLRDGDADASGLVEGIEGRVEALRVLTGGVVSVAGALCHRAASPVLLRPLHAGAVLIGGPEAVARLAARDGALTDTELTAVVDLLDRVCPPLSR